jgi:hypothetical protein
VTRYAWTKLNKLQVGAYAEYFVKMELTMLGFQVYSTEVDDRGVDFVARYRRASFIEVQVKSLRKPGYVYMEKAKFHIAPESYLALGLFFKDGEEPDLYLIPSNAWQTLEPPFVSRDYEGKKSKPEWGINLSKGNVSKLEPFRFHKIVGTITNGTG